MKLVNHSSWTYLFHSEQAPDKPTEIEIEFEKGNPVAIDGVKMSPATILTALNKLGGDNGIGRIDLVESRFVGMKSRGESYLCGRSDHRESSHGQGLFT